MLYCPVLVEQADLWKYLQGGLTLLLTGVAVYIAWRQHKTASDKLRLDLYDKRYNLYQTAVRYFVSAASTNGAELGDLDDLRREFTFKYRESLFLFDQKDEIFEELEDAKEIAKRISDYYELPLHVRNYNKNTNNEAYKTYVSDWKAIAVSIGFIEQKMMPYLNFRQAHSPAPFARLGHMLKRRLKGQ